MIEEVKRSAEQGEQKGQKYPGHFIRTFILMGNHMQHNYHTEDTKQDTDALGHSAADNIGDKKRLQDQK